MAYRKPIRKKCRSQWHPFPVAMKYRGWQFWKGRWGHLMECPVCDNKMLFDYLTPAYYHRVA